MKKAFMAAVITMMFALLLTACATPHTHIFGEWSSANGDEHKRVCTECGQEEIEAHTMVDCVCSVCGYAVHTFGEWTYKNDEQHNRFCSECLSFEEEAHNMYDGACTVCDYSIYDVTFELVGQTYVVSGISSRKSGDTKKIIVPSSFKGLPVTAVKNEAFMESRAFDEIVLPSGLLTIGERAFYKCEMSSITLPDTIKELGVAALRDCSRLEEITLPSGLLTIKERALCNCTRLREIVVPDTVTYIGKMAFDGCTDLQTLTVPFVGDKAEDAESTNFGYWFGAGNNPWYNNSYVPERLRTVIITKAESIAANSFYECRHLVEIVIPSSVKSIGENAFHNCPSLALVTFGGTKAEWLNIYNAGDWTSGVQGFRVTCSDGMLDALGNEIEEQ